MAVPRARAVAVATGVPAAFAMLAGVLAFGSAGAQATPSGPVTSVDTTSAPWFVHRDLVRSAMTPLRVDYRVRTTDPVVFITIDDGVTKDRRGLRYVEAHEIPVTAFLTAWTVIDAAPYFTRITRWGSVQNHSATHASLARSTTDLEHEICYSQRALASAFGSRPLLMRPPYGDGGNRGVVQVTADRCGIDRIILWNAVVENGHLTRAGGELRAGDIVLLHFTPHLEKDLTAAIRAARAAGLTPASLADYLPADDPRP